MPAEGHDPDAALFAMQPAIDAANRELDAAIDTLAKAEGAYSDKEPDRPEQPTIVFFAEEQKALDAFIAAHDPRDAVAALDIPVLLLHAEGDEQVPVELSRELATVLSSPRSRLIALPGGHHRSIQHLLPLYPPTHSACPASSVLPCSP